MITEDRLNEYYLDINNKGYEEEKVLYLNFYSIYNKRIISIDR